MFQGNIEAQKLANMEKPVSTNLFQFPGNLISSFTRVHSV